MAKLVIFGAGDIARLAHYYFTHDSEHEIAAFTVDRSTLKNRRLLNYLWSRLKKFMSFIHRKNTGCLWLLSYTQLNKIRAEKYYQAKQFGYDLVSYVSSRCYLSHELSGW